MSNQANAAENKDEMRVILKRLLDEQQRQAHAQALLSSTIQTLETRLSKLELDLP